MPGRFFDIIFCPSYYAAASKERLSFSITPKKFLRSSCCEQQNEQLTDSFPVANDYSINSHHFIYQELRAANAPPPAPAFYALWQSKSEAV